MLHMENLARLRHLEARRRDMLGLAVVAKAQYLALNGERSSTPLAIERARTEWQNIEAQKVAVAFQIRKLQALTEDLPAGRQSIAAASPATEELFR